jgi:hypothetical protein
MAEARRTDHPGSAPGEVALRYAAHGWPVLPLHTPHDGVCSCRAEHCGSPGKHPRTPRGLHEATTDAEQVSIWWRRWPDANLGVVTGAVSGLVVLDVDLPDGPASLRRLEAEHALLPATCEQRTGSGGRQLLFAHPGHPVGNRARLLPGIDVRGDGGYIVVPPSTHASGTAYRWTGRVPPAHAPGWLLELLDRTRTPDLPARTTPAALPTGDREQRYAASALHRELAVLAAAPEGSRNDTLNRAAFNLGQLAAAGLLDPRQVAAELERVAIGIGLGPVETRRTIASGLSAASQHPRAVPALSPPPQSAGVPVRRIGARHR